MCVNVNNHPKPLVIDTSPLLLLLIGAYDKNMIKKFGRTEKYTESDFDILVQFLVTRKVYVTAGVLAEVSHFAEELKDNRFQELIDRNMENLRKMGECHIGKDIIIENVDFKRFGFTDTSILLAAKKNDWEILTDDHPLFGKCWKIGIPAHHMMELQSISNRFA